MKSVLKAVMAVAGIIAAQMILSYVFTYQVAEMFSKISLGVLFYYYIVKMINKKLTPAK